MSLHALDWAFKLPIPPTQKLVLLAMADHADAEGVCWPSVPNLCAKTSLARRTVFAMQAWLEAHGLIQKVEQGGGRGYSTRWRLAVGAEPIHPAAMDGVGISSRPARRKGAADAPIRGKGAARAPFPENGASHAPETVHHMHQNGASHAPEPSYEPSKGTVISLRGGPSARRPAAGPLTDRDWLWSEGVRIVRAFTGNGDATTRSFIGKLVKEASNDVGRVRAAIERAADERPIGVQAWLMRAVKGRRNGFLDIFDALEGGGHELPP